MHFFFAGLLPPRGVAETLPLRSRPLSIPPGFSSSSLQSGEIAARSRSERLLFVAACGVKSGSLACLFGLLGVAGFWLVSRWGGCGSPHVEPFCCVVFVCCLDCLIRGPLLRLGWWDLCDVVGWWYCDWMRLILVRMLNFFEEKIVLILVFVVLLNISWWMCTMLSFLIFRRSNFISIYISLSCFFFKLSCSYYLCLCALVPGLVCFLYNGVDFLFMISVVCVCVCLFLLFLWKNCFLSVRCSI